MQLVTSVGVLGPVRFCGVPGPPGSPGVPVCPRSLGSSLSSLWLPSVSPGLFCGLLRGSPVLSRCLLGSIVSPLALLLLVSSVSSCSLYYPVSLCELDFLPSFLFLCASPQRDPLCVRSIPDLTTYSPFPAVFLVVLLPWLLSVFLSSPLFRRYCLIPIYFDSLLSVL